MSLFKVYLLYIVKCKWNTVILYEALQKVYSFTVHCLLLDYIPVLSTKSLNDWGHSYSPNIWLHPSTILGHCKPMIENVVYKCGSYLIRNTDMSSASSASSSVCLPTPLPLLLLSGCWPCPIPCPSIVRYCNIVLCSGIYILTSWWFTRCTFVRESQDSPGSNLPIQDRFRKKSLMEMYRNAWHIMTTCSTILHVKTYAMN